MAASDRSTCAAFATLQGNSCGTVKQEDFKAGNAKLLPMAPVTAFWGVQPGAIGKHQAILWAMRLQHVASRPDDFDGYVAKAKIFSELKADLLTSILITYSLQNRSKVVRPDSGVSTIRCSKLLPGKLPG
jgi:hypothetical protein